MDTIKNILGLIALLIIVTLILAIVVTGGGVLSPEYW
jgi:hypothetical protein